MSTDLPQGFDGDDDDERRYKSPFCDLIEALNAGDMGEVEFTELALEAGMSIEQIGKELETARGEQ
jgi:hypothetical protein